MSLLSVDLGGTKASFAVFSEEGTMLSRELHLLQGRKGFEVCRLLCSSIRDLLERHACSNDPVRSVGIAVPGIARPHTGTVWAPNIPGWDDFPLMEEVRKVSGNIPVNMAGDRSCYILGESWKGNAKGCSNAVFLAVGTGIGAGIMANGELIEGNAGIAGATGWMALDKPFREKYSECGCFEYNASGEGLVKVVRELIASGQVQSEILGNIPLHQISTRDIFEAYGNDDSAARIAINNAIIYWGMAIANLVSIFNPEKIILGGGLFGPASQFIPALTSEASKWAQPISMRQVSVEVSLLGGDAGIYGAACLALKNLKQE